MWVVAFWKFVGLNEETSRRGRAPRGSTFFISVRAQTQPLNFRVSFVMPSCLIRTKLPCPAGSDCQHLRRQQTCGGVLSRCWSVRKLLSALKQPSLSPPCLSTTKRPFLPSPLQRNKDVPRDEVRRRRRVQSFGSHSSFCCLCLSFCLSAALTNLSPFSRRL